MASPGRSTSASDAADVTSIETTSATSGEPTIDGHDRDAPGDRADGRVDIDLDEHVEPGDHDEPGGAGVRRRSPAWHPARWIAATRGAVPATWVMLALIVAYVWYFTDRTLDIHHGLGTSAYDSGLYDQGVWLLSRFHSPFVTLMGRNLFGDHASFVLVGLVPLYWIAPGAWILFFSQSALLGAGALPVYQYARRHLRSDWLGVLFGTVYLLHPAVSWTNMENFHPDAYLGLFVGLALYGALEQRWRIYWVGVVLAVLVKEDVSLVLVPLGLWVAVRRDARRGVMTIVAAVWMAVFGMFIVMKSLIGVPTRNTWRIPFGGVRGLIETSVRNPTQVADHLRSEGRPWYVWQMLAPVGFFFRRAPSVAMISLLVIFTNVLSTYWYQFHIQYHYSLIAVPAIVFGTVYALGTVPDLGHWTRNRSIGAVALCSVLAAYAWAPLPHTPSNPVFWPPDHPVAEAARDIIDDLPDDAVISVHYRIAPHVAYRREVYQFPNPFRIVLYGPDTSLEGTRETRRAERVEYLVLQVSKSPEDEADFAVIRPAFTLVRANASWELWRRDRDVPLPPLVPAAG